MVSTLSTPLSDHSLHLTVKSLTVKYEEWWLRGSIETRLRKPDYMQSHIPRSVGISDCPEAGGCKASVKAMKSSTGITVSCLVPGVGSANKWYLCFYLLKDPVARDNPQTLASFLHPQDRRKCRESCLPRWRQCKGSLQPQEEPKPFQEQSPYNMVKCSHFGEKPSATPILTANNHCAPHVSVCKHWVRSWITSKESYTPVNIHFLGN